MTYKRITATYYNAHGIMSYTMLFLVDTYHIAHKFLFFFSYFSKDIYSIQHEINFWDEKSQNASSKSDKEAANAFSMAVNNLNQHLR